MDINSTQYEDQSIHSSLFGSYIEGGSVVSLTPTTNGFSTSKDEINKSPYRHLGL